MSPADIYAMSTEMLMAVLKASAPVLIVALAVGLVIALVQALTQVQEMTLTFVPKIAAIFAAVIASLPLIFNVLSGLSETVFELIRQGGS